MTCNNELNKQMKSLQARVSQAENNITNHFAGISTLVMAMSANPLTAGPAAAVSSIYNLGTSGFSALQGLIDQINPLDTKQLMMQLAAGLEEAMEGEILALKGMVESAIDDAIAAAGTALDAAIASAESAAVALEDAIAAGIEGPILLAQAALDSANATVASAQSALDSLGNLKISSGNMLQNQADLASCKSTGLHIAS